MLIVTYLVVKTFFSCYLVDENEAKSGIEIVQTYRNRTEIHVDRTTLYILGNS